MLATIWKFVEVHTLILTHTNIQVLLFTNIKPLCYSHLTFFLENRGWITKLSWYFLWIQKPTVLSISKIGRIGQNKLTTLKFTYSRNWRCLKPHVLEYLILQLFRWSNEIIPVIVCIWMPQQWFFVEVIIVMWWFLKQISSHYQWYEVKSIK